MILSVICGHFTPSSSFFSMRFVGQDMRHSRELCRRPTGEFDGDAGDAIEAHEWKCVRTFNGIISCFKHVDEISL